VRSFPERATDVVAHRGASAYAPENTLAAHDLALAQRADALELDVRATADGTLVLSHDETLLRTTGDPRRVDELTADDIAAIPSLSRPVELEDLLRRYGRRTRYLLDLKDPAPAWERDVLDAIDRHDLRDRVIVQSFDRGSLRRLRDACQWVALNALYRRAEDPYEDLPGVATYATSVGAWHDKIDAGFVAQAKAAGLAVRTWTVNEPDDIARAMAIGVDGLITNAPDVARQVVDEPMLLAA
jgi:glycerophosphoryl diester phosphodiesterase